MLAQPPRILREPGRKEGALACGVRGAREFSCGVCVWGDVGFTLSMMVYMYKYMHMQMYICMYVYVCR